MKAAPRLGRGLAALLGEEQSASDAPPSPGVTELALDRLDTNPFQPRGTISPDTLIELAESITRQGILQPLLVRPHPTDTGRFQIIAGERRWRAARQAGLSSVPCYVRVLDNATVSAAALVENLQRRDLNPIEEAFGYRRLMTEFGMTQESLSTSIGKSRSHVANMVRLLQLPESVQEQLRAGLLSAGHARAALAAEDPAAAADIMVADGLNVRQAEALTATTTNSRQARSSVPPRETASPDLRDVEANLSETLGMKVGIRFTGRGGHLRVDYQTLDQLDHLIAKLGSGR